MDLTSKDDDIKLVNNLVGIFVVKMITINISYALSLLNMIPIRDKIEEEEVQAIRNPLENAQIATNNIIRSIE